MKAIDQDSKQLAAALIDGTKIVITTLQKFPFVLRGLLHAAGAESQESAPAKEKAAGPGSGRPRSPQRKYAVIVDEAHSSQIRRDRARAEGDSWRNRRAIPARRSRTGKTGLNQVMPSRGRQPNLSFFAFTATPKGKTLELFGRPGQNGTPEAFHLYSMRQAIEENFILDVLTNYTTYATYYRLLKAAEDDPNLPKKKAARALAKFMSLHPHNIEQKTEVMVGALPAQRQASARRQGKAMVVTSSRLHAVRYKLAFERYIAENGYTDIRPLVAFSGTVRDPDTGIEYTEPGMNKDVVTGKPISEAAAARALRHRPTTRCCSSRTSTRRASTSRLLHTMYVDKRLDGVQAVQTLSRLNRMIPGKDAPFVLDFVNDAENIFRAFKPYYDKTELAEASDPATLEALKHELDQAQVYHWSEVEAFAQVFYKPAGRQSAGRPRAHAAAPPAGRGPVQELSRTRRSERVSREARAATCRSTHS